MENEMPSDLKKLWDISGAKPSKENGWLQYFDPVGLILLFPLENYKYWCTPVNSKTFATTGGDGVHFGFLSMDGVIDNNSPIVMTVPMGFDKPNLIVGKNLREFLALGCKFGYFSLEQLLYDKENTIKELKKKEYLEDFSEKEIILLSAIESEFKLSPWENPGERLDELQKEHGATIEMLPNDHL